MLERQCECVWKKERVGESASMSERHTDRERERERQRGKRRTFVGPKQKPKGDD